MTPRSPEQIDQAAIDNMAKTFATYGPAVTREAVAAHQRMMARRDLRVEQLEARQVEMQAVICQLRADCLSLAKLAHPLRQFFNPLVAAEAQSLRDRVLAEVNPNG